MLTTDMTNLKYVAVEVIKNPGTKLIDVECGAFMGILEHKNTTGVITSFIALQNTENSVRLYNLAEYGIMTIQAETVDMKYMTVFMKTDQKEAVSILKQIVAAMKAEQRLIALKPDNELINVDSYKAMPDSVLTGSNLSTTVVNKTKITGVTTDSNTVINGYNTGYAGCNYSAPKPTVLNFKRKGKLPAEARLAKMHEMVVALASDAYEIKVPIPKHDLPDKKEVTEVDKEAHP